MKLPRRKAQGKISGWTIDLDKFQSGKADVYERDSIDGNEATSAQHPDFNFVFDESRLESGMGADKSDLGKVTWEISLEALRCRHSLSSSICLSRISEVLRKW